MVVMSLTWADVEPGLETVAELDWAEGALEATLTRTVMGGSVPFAASTALVVQVRVPTVQDQPLPDIAVTVSPGSGLSTTVIVPDVEPGPLLPTVTV